MAEAIKGDVVYSFKWYHRPETQPSVVPVVQVTDDVDIPFEEIPNVLQEIDLRHWSAVRQILIEAKLKAEAMLRSDDVIKNVQLSTHYQGWVNYADYCLANLEGLRAGLIGPDENLPAEPMR
jgi:hypothetical protein